MSPDSLGGDSIVVDYDGNIYEVIKIGDQYWMTENLRVTHYKDERVFSTDSIFRHAQTSMDL